MEGNADFVNNTEDSSADNPIDQPQQLDYQIPEDIPLPVPPLPEVSEENQAWKKAQDALRSIGSKNTYNAQQETYISKNYVWPPQMSGSTMYSAPVYLPPFPGASGFNPYYQYQQNNRFSSQTTGGYRATHPLSMCSSSEPANLTPVQLSAQTLSTNIGTGYYDFLIILRNLLS